MFGSGSKLRTPITVYGPLGIFIGLLATIVESLITQHPFYSVWLFGAYFILLGVAEFIRTRLWLTLVLGVLFGTGTWHSLASLPDSPVSWQTYLVHVLATAIFLIFALPSIIRQEKLDRRARFLLRLAADSVVETGDGFTARPYSAGNVEYTRDEIIGFGRYMDGKSIVKAHVDAERVLLTFSLGISPLKNPDKSQISYVSFDFDGAMSVHISAYDYRQYKDRLTFDRLCASLGEVMKRFLGYYRLGREDRIVVELLSAGR
jgi:hypothetical protein